MIVNDSDEEYICKNVEVITTLIPDPMGIAGWYGEEQAAQVKRETPWEFTGPIPSPNGEVKSPAPPKNDVKEEITIATIPAVAIKQELESMEVHLTPTKSDEYPKEVKFLEIVELSPIVMHSPFSDHIIEGINKCALEGIKLEGGKRKKQRCLSRLDKQLF